MTPVGATARREGGQTLRREAAPTSVRTPRHSPQRGKSIFDLGWLGLRVQRNRQTQNGSPLSRG